MISDLNQKPFKQYLIKKLRFNHKLNNLKIILQYFDSFIIILD